MGVDGTCVVSQRYYQWIKEGRIKLDVSNVPDHILLPQSPAESSGGGVDYFPEDDADPPITDSYSKSLPPRLVPEVNDPSPKRSAPSPDEYNNTVYSPEYVCQVSIIEYFAIFYIYFVFPLVFLTTGLL